MNTLYFLYLCLSIQGAVHDISSGSRVSYFAENLHTQKPNKEQTNKVNITDI